MNLFLDQEAYPEQRKENDKKDSEYNPSGRGDPAFDSRQELAHAVRATIVPRHVLRIACDERLRVWLSSCARTRVRLILIRLPRVRSRSLIVVLRRRLRLLLRIGWLNHKLGSAKPAELTFNGILLTAILTSDHMLLEV